MSDYDTDVFLWSEHQADLPRRVAAGENINDQVDWPNVIEEVETVGRSERAALRSHIAAVLEHLIKLQASPATDPRNERELLYGLVFSAALPWYFCASLSLLTSILLFSAWSGVFPSVAAADCCGLSWGWPAAWAVRGVVLATARTTAAAKISGFMALSLWKISET